MIIETILIMKHVPQTIKFSDWDPNLKELYKCSSCCLNWALNETKINFIGCNEKLQFSTNLILDLDDSGYIDTTVPNWDVNRAN